MAIVFTHCDQNSKFTKEKAVNFLNSLMQTLVADGRTPPIIPNEKNIFLFKGDPEDSDCTKQSEILTWL